MTAASAALSAQVATISGCGVLPANNVWNTPVDTLPVDANSAAYIASMNATNNKLHPDFGYGTMLTGGMPYNLVPGTQPKFPVTFYYSGDAGPYPIPANVLIEGGSDHHAIIIDTTNCVDYELFNLSQPSPGSWRAGSGAIFNLNSNALRPDGQNSADAAGLPIFPGLIRYDEIASGQITHALRVTADHTRNAHIWPARSSASSRSGLEYPPMGQRFRLKASYDISRFAQPVKVILQAAKTYGLILADNGTSWHLGGVGDLRFNDTVMHALTQVTGDNFEAVDESGLMVDINSAEVQGANTPPPTVPTGTINIVSKFSGKCLDVRGGTLATQATTQIQQWSCLGSAQTNQVFQFVPVSGGYKVVAQNSGLAVQVTGGAAATSGSPLEIWPFGGQTYQTWTVNHTSDGYWTINPVSAPGSCMNVRGASTGNGALIQQYSCVTADNNKWSFNPIQ